MTARKFKRPLLPTQTSNPSTKQGCSAHSKKKDCRHMATDGRPCESPGGLSQLLALLRSEKHVRQFPTTSIFRARSAAISRPACVARAANNRRASDSPVVAWHPHRAWLGRTSLV